MSRARLFASLALTVICTVASAATPTGSIAGTYSLSGYLAKADDTLAFSIVLNRCFDKKSAFEFFARMLGTL